MASENSYGLEAVTFTVTPDELRVKAEDVRKFNKTISAQWSDIYRRCKDTVRYWNSDGADAFRNTGNLLNQLLDQFFEKWEDVAVRLEKIAGVYDEAENQATAATEQLPCDILK